MKKVREKKRKRKGEERRKTKEASEAASLHNSRVFFSSLSLSSSAVTGLARPLSLFCRPRKP
jgi:hypothetical protein